VRCAGAIAAGFKLTGKLTLTPDGRCDLCRLLLMLMA
jgi:hypothetical protein